MNNGFTFDFNNLLRAVQPKPLRIWIQILVSLTIFSVAEITFYSNFRNMQVTECSLPNNSTSMSLDNCFYNNNELTTCVNNEFKTGSNYSLQFTVDLLGIKGDKYSRTILACVIIVFSAYMLLFQSSHYISFQKRKRIQDILAETKIFIDGKKKYERRLTISFFCIAAVYVALKVTWIAYRDSQYGTFICNSQTYKVLFQTTVGSSIGTLIQSSLGLIIMPLIYIGSYINYVNDVDLKSILAHLSKSTTKEFHLIRLLDVEKYREIIAKEVDKRYQKESAFFRFLRRNTFTSWKTPTSEIVQILLAYQKENQHEFQTIQYNEEKISFKGQVNEENQKLIN